MRRVLSQLLYAVERHHAHPHASDGNDAVIRKFGEAEGAPRLWPEHLNVNVNVILNSAHRIKDSACSL